MVRRGAHRLLRHHALGLTEVRFQIQLHTYNPAHSFEVPTIRTPTAALMGSFILLLASLLSGWTLLSKEPVAQAWHNRVGRLPSGWFLSLYKPSY